MIKKSFRRKLAAIGLSFALSIPIWMSTISQSHAGRQKDFEIAFSLEQLSKYKTSSGYEAVENSVTESEINGSYKNFDGFVWGAQNNRTGDFNEVDFGIGYTLPSNPISENLNARLGYERWEYPEFGGKNEILTLGINYSNPKNQFFPDIGFKATKLIDERGKQFKGTISKGFPLGEYKGCSLTASPFATISYCDEFFGVTGISNHLFGTSLSIEKTIDDHTVWITGTYEYHDGKQRYDDADVLGLGISYKFKF